VAYEKRKYPEGPNASPGTAATSASSKINVASSADVFGVLPRIVVPSTPFTDG
jgi:hypothetical protein